MRKFFQTKDFVILSLSHSLSLSPSSGQYLRWQRRAPVPSFSLLAASEPKDPDGRRNDNKIDGPDLALVCNWIKLITLADPPPCLAGNDDGGRLPSPINSRKLHVSLELYKTNPITGDRLSKAQSHEESFTLVGSGMTWNGYGGAEGCFPSPPPPPPPPRSVNRNKREAVDRCAASTALKVTHKMI